MDSQIQYEIQFYNMPLNKINSLIKEEICAIILNNIDQMYATFMTKSNDVDDNTYKNLLSEKENVKKVILSKIEKPMEKFQTHLYTNFKIPNNILLPEDEIYTNSLDSNRIEELNSEISNLENEILKTKYKLKKITLKTKQIENLSTEIDELKTSLLKIPIDQDDNKIANDIFTHFKELKQKAKYQNDIIEISKP